MKENKKSPPSPKLCILQYKAVLYHIVMRYSYVTHAAWKRADAGHQQTHQLRRTPRLGRTLEKNY